MTAEDRTVHNTPGTGGRTDIDTSRGYRQIDPEQSISATSEKESSGDNNSAGIQPSRAPLGFSQSEHCRDSGFFRTA